MTSVRVPAIAAVLSLSALASCAGHPTLPPAPPFHPAIASRPAAFHAVPEPAATLDNTPAEVEILNRITWGVNAADAQAIHARGIKSYLAAQLRPAKDDGLPPEAQVQIDAMQISQLSVAQIFVNINDARKYLDTLKGKPEFDDAQKAFQQKLNDTAREAATRSSLRDLYSENQLKEQLTWFWMNHFNVSQSKGDIRALIGDYEENAIRPHVLGKFRDLLAATVFHPAMLQYLDNAQNAAGHINENYAREIMELHTLGVGSGYTQKDVQELARVLTGLGVNLTGKIPNIKKELRLKYEAGNLIEFNPARHDFGEKLLLGQHIKGTGLGEIMQAIDVLAREPATAHFISTELATYFCRDTPPATLVDAMASTFRYSGGDIAAVLKTMFAAPEFKASLAHKFKDPIHYAVSALRAAYGQTVIVNSGPLLNWLGRMGEPLYGHETPDGYPMTSDYWSGPGQMETRFEIARQIGLGHSGLFKLPDDKTPEPAPPPNIRLTHYYGAIAPTLAATTGNALAQAPSPLDWNLLFLSSPEFMQR